MDRFKIKNLGLRTYKKYNHDKHTKFVGSFKNFDENKIELFDAILKLNKVESSSQVFVEVQDTSTEGNYVFIGSIQ